MTDDVLAPWIAAYREENPGTALDANAIRRRVFAAFASRQRRRFGAMRFVLPVAATFFGSVALAASQGVLPRLDEVREWLGMSASGKRAAEDGRVRGAVEVCRAPPPAVRRDDALRAAEPERPAIAPPPFSIADLPVGPSAPTPVARSKAAPVGRSGAAPVAPSETAPAPLEAPHERRDALSADLRAYQTAHRLHFDGGDPLRALAAWDAYLDAYPADTFAPEARFNRAVCLLRLGRRAEARSVLVPIAESSFAFGRDRARALLDAMGK
jgi:tetratricopeptide (TPR) repeat protein